MLMGNPAVSRLVGYSWEELEQMNVAKLYEDPQDRAKLRAALEGGDVVRDFRVRLKRKDGSAFLASLCVIPMFLGGQKVFLTAVQEAPVCDD